MRIRSSWFRWKCSNIDCETMDWPRSYLLSKMVAYSSTSDNHRPTKNDLAVVKCVMVRLVTVMASVQFGRPPSAIFTVRRFFLSLISICHWLGERRTNGQQHWNHFHFSSLSIWNVHFEFRCKTWKVHKILTAPISYPNGIQMANAIEHRPTTLLDRKIIAVAIVIVLVALDSARNRTVYMLIHRLTSAITNDSISWQRDVFVLVVAHMHETECEYGTCEQMGWCQLHCISFLLIAIWCMFYCCKWCSVCTCWLLLFQQTVCGTTSRQRRVGSRRIRLRCAESVCEECVRSSQDQWRSTQLISRRCI